MADAVLKCYESCKQAFGPRASSESSNGTLRTADRNLLIAHARLREMTLWQYKSVLVAMGFDEEANASDFKAYLEVADKAGISRIRFERKERGQWEPHYSPALKSSLSPSLRVAWTKLNTDSNDQNSSVCLNELGACSWTADPAGTRKPSPDGGTRGVHGWFYPHDAVRVSATINARPVKCIPLNPSSIRPAFPSEAEVQFIEITLEPFLHPAATYEARLAHPAKTVDFDLLCRVFKIGKPAEVSKDIRTLCGDASTKGIWFFRDRDPVVRLETGERITSASRSENSARLGSQGWHDQRAQRVLPESLSRLRMRSVLAVERACKQLGSPSLLLVRDLAADIGDQEHAGQMSRVWRYGGGSVDVYFGIEPSSGAVTAKAIRIDLALANSEHTPKSRRR